MVLNNAFNKCFLLILFFLYILYNVYVHSIFFLLVLEIASLKAALARKDGEREHLQHSQSSSPERFRLKSAGSSPSHHSWKSLKDFSGGRRQPMEDVGNVEV